MSPNEGVTGDPSATPSPGDVSGSQGASSGSPPVSEGKTPVQQNASPPSGFGDLGQEQGRIPYSRFEEVTQKLKEAERINAELRSQMQQFQQAPATNPQQPVSQQPTQGGHLDAQILQAQHALAAAKESGDSMSEANALSTLIRLQSQANATNLLEGYIKTQQEASERHQFDQLRRDNWERLFREYPAMNDPNSEFRKAVEQEWASDPWLKVSASGEYDAANRVAARMARQNMGGAEQANVLRNQLAMGQVSPTEPSPESKRASSFQKAIEGLNAEDESHLESYILDQMVKGRDKK